MLQLSDVISILRIFKKDGFNIFFGAGVSKDFPTNAPIWNEMQTKFLLAIFDRMESEGWPAVVEFPADKDAVNDFRIRPESFWHTISGEIDISIIHAVLSEVDQSIPNDNHQLIAQLLANGVIKNAITTNFDEYIDRILLDQIQIVIPTDKWTEPTLKYHECYIKIHGTISSPDSLSYTLEHYDALQDRNRRLLLKSLPDLPLIIAGYSGYDTDVLPVLDEISGIIPSVMVIKHPDAGMNEPILKLANKKTNWHVVEAKCTDVLSLLCDNKDDAFSQKKSEIKIDKQDTYRIAAQKVPIPLCPYLVLKAYDFAGYQGGKIKYAWLTYDSITDERYRSSLSTKHIINLCIAVGTSLAACGDERYRVMFSEARSIAKFMESRSTLYRIKMYEESASSRLKFVLNGNQKSQTGEPKGDGFPLIEVIKKLADTKNNLEYLWDLGLQAKRNGHYSNAMILFERALEILLSLSERNAISHIDKGHFFLDIGDAMALWAEEERDEDASKSALKYFQIAERESNAVQDWKTHARALFNLSGMYFWWNKKHIENIKIAKKHIEKAKQSVSRTYESKLKEKIDALSAEIDKYLV